MKCSVRIFPSIGSSGRLVRGDMPPGRYSMRIIASDPATRERAVLRGYFYIPKLNPLTRELPCGATIINTSSERQGSAAKVQFRGTGSARSFECRLDRGENRSCELRHVVGIFWQVYFIRWEIILFFVLRAN